MKHVMWLNSSTSILSIVNINELSFFVQKCHNVTAKGLYWHILRKPMTKLTWNILRGTKLKCLDQVTHVTSLNNI
jgi:hypothetical protein